jgi:hypothetical protein
MFQLRHRSARSYSCCPVVPALSQMKCPSLRLEFFGPNLGKTTICVCHTKAHSVGANWPQRLHVWAPVLMAATMQGTPSSSPPRAAFIWFPLRQGSKMFSLEILKYWRSDCFLQITLKENGPNALEKVVFITCGFWCDFFIIFFLVKWKRRSEKQNQETIYISIKVQAVMYCIVMFW